MIKNRSNMELNKTVKLSETAKKIEEEFKESLDNNGNLNFSACFEKACRKVYDDLKTKNLSFSGFKDRHCDSPLKSYLQNLFRESK